MKERAQRLWHRLNKEQHKEIAAAFVHSLEGKGLSREGVRDVSSYLRLRSSMVERARGDQLGRLLLQAVGAGSEWAAKELLGGFLKQQDAAKESEIPETSQESSALDYRPVLDADSMFDESPELAAPYFSALDKLIIRALLASLNNVTGSLTEDELDDLIHETLELNDRRTQTSYHRGFFDSLLDRDCQPMASREDAPKRAWYLVGYFQGITRRHDMVQGVAFMTELDSSDKNALLSPPTRAGEFVIPYLIRPLLDSQNWDDAATWLETYLPTTAENVIPRVVKWARMALLASDPGNITRILELCCAKAGEIKNLESSVIDPLVNQLERRLAIGLRLQGRVTQAESMIDRLLKTETKEKSRSKLLGDKLLIRMGMRSLEDLRIRKTETREALRAALDGVSYIWEEATGNDGVYSPASDLAAAINVVLNGTDSTTAILKAIACVNRAIRSMEAKHLAFWTERGVLQRARFYLCVLELRLLDPVAGAPALTRLIHLIESGLHEPLDLMVDAIEHAVAQDLADSERLANIALKRWPQAVLAELNLKGLVRRSRPVRGQIVQSLEANKERLKANERWRAWSDVLKGSLEADERDIETAQLALDEMETLAESHGFEEEFNELLQISENWDPAWTPMEAAIARFRVLEKNGKLIDARAALVSITHSVITERGDDAIELIEQLKLLGADDDTLRDLDSRYKASMPEEEPSGELSSAPDEPVSIFFIGGDETQAHYVKRISEDLKETHPGCDVHFEIPNWTSNWGRELDKYVRTMEKSDSIVLMRFIRTNLGRHLRKAASETNTPWIPCTGQGYGAMLRAIKRAISVAREQQRR